MRGIILSFTILLGMFLSSCASSYKESFDSIEVGMEKFEVIEKMDSPYHVYRQKGIDKWKYVYYEDDKRHEKFVHFDNGRVIYKGDYIPPTSDAKVEDQKNAEENAVIAQEWDQQHQERTNRHVSNKKELEKDYMDFLLKKGQKSKKAEFKPVD
jgi:outer membrane protein assembly factor BamE (lipoprotein component of BamABCDE complex)